MQRPSVRDEWGESQEHDGADSLRALICFSLHLESYRK